jgi:hypothetical protein
VDSGDIIGEVCKELEVVADEALTAEAGTDAEEGREVRKVVWTWLGFVCFIDEDGVGWEVEVEVIGGSSEVVAANKAGLEVPVIAPSENEEFPNGRALQDCR